MDSKVEVNPEGQPPKDAKEAEEIDWDNEGIVTDDVPEAAQQATAQPGKMVAAATPGLAEDERDSRSVFVKNVHFRAQEKELEEHFAESGKILKVTIRKDKMTNQPLGYAYIEFETVEGA